MACILSIIYHKQEPSHAKTHELCLQCDVMANARSSFSHQTCSNNRLSTNIIEEKALLVPPDLGSDPVRRVLSREPYFTC